MSKENLITVNHAGRLGVVVTSKTGKLLTNPTADNMQKILEAFKQTGVILDFKSVEVDLPGFADGGRRWTISVDGALRSATRRSKAIGRAIELLDNVGTTTA